MNLADYAKELELNLVIQKESRRNQLHAPNHVSQDTAGQAERHRTRPCRL